MKKDRDSILAYYEKDDQEGFQKKEELTEEDNIRLRVIFSKYNRLIVADNGVGMSLSDVKTKWMYIGTSDKEVNYRSEKGRIKTGEKGIGREQNPALYDMANREGLTQNDEYHIFVDILQEAIHVFETDRQGFYREYMRWHDEIEKTFGVDANIRADAVANMEVTGRTKSYENSPANDFKIGRAHV